MSVHIGAKPGEIAKGILLPGDPQRAKYVAEHFFENPVCFNKVRGMLGFTGTYKGKRVSVMGTGMGIPSISIYANELFGEYDVDCGIRIGTCGAMQPEIGMKDIVIAEGACTDNDFNRRIFNGSYCPIADFGLLRAAYLNSKKLGLSAKVGNVVSGDLFYALANDETRDNMWEKFNVIAGEMEAAGLYTAAKRHQKRALAMVTVSDNQFVKGKMTTEERERSLGDMITLALETICEFI